MVPFRVATAWCQGTNLGRKKAFQVQDGACSACPACPWCRQAEHPLPRPNGLSYRPYHKSGGSIFNGHHWSHIAFPFTETYHAAKNSTYPRHINTFWPGSFTGCIQPSYPFRLKFSPPETAHFDIHFRSTISACLMITVGAGKLLCILRTTTKKAGPSLTLPWVHYIYKAISRSFLSSSFPEAPSP